LDADATIVLLHEERRYKVVPIVKAIDNSKRDLRSVLAHRVYARRGASASLDSGSVLLENLARYAVSLVLIVSQIEPDTVDLLKLRCQESNTVGYRSAFQNYWLHRQHSGVK
jgi:hypothetical protein